MEQDYCSPTLDFDPIGFDTSPFFEIGPADLPISMLGYSLTIYDEHQRYVSARWRRHGPHPVSGSLDLRDLGHAREYFRRHRVDADSACDLVLMFGVSCTMSRTTSQIVSAYGNDIGRPRRHGTRSGGRAGEHPECEE